MNEDSVQHRLERNRDTVLQRIERAAARSGRSPDSVRLIAVTKYVPVEIAARLAAMGQRDLGESRPQQLWERAEVLADSAVVWHLIGPLQKNKIRKTLKYASWIHSVESWELLAAVDRIAAEQGLRPAVLLEVNTSQNPAKHGFQPDALLASADRLTQFEHVAIRGLMCMAGWEGDLEGARRDFQSLRQLQDRLRRQLPNTFALEDLSMGMSGDFEIAVEEGATMVRVGSLLFEGIEPDATEA
ncbi:YggS family pyridoxal phosphate-dependent enzyme [Thermopirellula anaerolimosa]